MYIAVVRDGDKYARIAANGTTAVPVNNGTLGALVVSDPGVGWAIDIYDGSAVAANKIFSWNTSRGAGYFPIHARLYNNTLTIVASGATPGLAIVTHG